MSERVILVTGSRKGIGRALVEHFVALGHRVHGCSRSEPRWQLEGYVHHLADVTDERQVKTMLRAIKKGEGRLEVLVNNAGMASMNHVLLSPTSVYEKIMNTNMRGTFLLCREAAKIMRRGRWGRIVNISSVAVPMLLEGEALYAASKSAVVTFTRILARELAPQGITCNVVGPTPIETDLIRGVPAEKIDAIVRRLPIQRLGRFADVANVVEFFLRPESDYITGQVLHLGGV